jgi:hypothetical protein
MLTLEARGLWSAILAADLPQSLARAIGAKRSFDELSDDEKFGICKVIASARKAANEAAAAAGSAPASAPAAKPKNGDKGKDKGPAPEPPPPKDKAKEGEKPAS